jgi:hypothetical protein
LLTHTAIYGHMTTKHVISKFLHSERQRAART